MSDIKTWIDLNFFQIKWEKKTETVLFCHPEVLASSLGPIAPHVGINARNLGVIVDGAVKQDKQVNAVGNFSFF